MTIEQGRGITSSRRIVILFLYNKVQLFLVYIYIYIYIKLFLYSPVQSSLKHDEAMRDVSGDQNESGSFTEKGRLRVADFPPVVENRIRFSLICGASGRRARSERFNL
jgi:hypothetical protein